VLGQWILYHNAAVTLLHQSANLQVDFRRLHGRRIKLGPLVKVDFASVRVEKVLFFCCRKKSLLSAPG